MDLGFVIIYRQVVFHLKPAWLRSPGKIPQRRSFQAGDELCAAFIQPVNHLRQTPALIVIWAVDVFVLEEQLYAPLNLALAGKE